MNRISSAQMQLEAVAPARLVLSIAPAAGLDSTEQLSVLQAGESLPVREIHDEFGTRLHLVDVQAGGVDVNYSVAVTGQAEPAAVTEIDRIRYLRPSRYCESDRVGAMARAEFSGLTGRDLLAGVSSWVGQKLVYVPGASLPTDGAVRTLIARQGVCRDYAHLVAALLRAVDVPTRVVSVYAPGLDPMDFHAVAEALIDDVWQVVDATMLAPRQSLVRIATGRDAADTAFLTTIGGMVLLHTLEVTATVDVLPRDDVRELVELR
ncbi:transglutaminase family protein [Cryobacterium melibiosiphilum]|uniref:Transglutaminase family protein n=1 Tax=Cryobacterium melibiosiphilum TaxID=995039 RepID=A0A3A5MR32_9MICO|nr:transglutaminase family protein [Cryobacterium melibiosiphilum]RJT88476.1 transglutaminase family protein [Cryobacterium melibiosiphilum]